MDYKQSALNALAPRPPSKEQQMQLDYLEASWAIIKALADIESVTIHKLYVTPKGDLRKKGNYSPENAASRRQLLELLEYWQRQIFGEHGSCLK